MSIEAKSRGELPINWRITSFPSDARFVLQIRAAARRYQKENSLEGPVADLQAEQAILTSPIYARANRIVNQPITFSLPTPLLRVLAIF